MNPYRVPPARSPSFQQTAGPRSFLRPVCWILGHRWEITRRLAGAGHLSVFHPLAGCDAVCLRCNAVWLDCEYVLAVWRQDWGQDFPVSLVLKSDPNDTHEPFR